MITMLILDTLSCLGRYCILISQNIPDETLQKPFRINLKYKIITSILNLILNILLLLERVMGILCRLSCFRKHCILITENIPYESLQKHSIEI